MTVNKDTNTAGGWIGITKNETAINRWMQSQAQRFQIFNNCIEMAHKERFRSPSKQNESFERDILNVISSIETFINPFDEKETGITNIMMGVGVSDEIKSDLHNAYAFSNLFL